MSLKTIIAEAIASSQVTITGKVASGFYEVTDIDGSYVWGCDVDIGQNMAYTDEYGQVQTTTVLQNVPIAMNNREIFYAQIGWPVVLRRLGNSGYAIVGMGKSIKQTTEITYVSFSNGITIISQETRGYYYRRLTLGEMGTIAPFGSLPLGAVGVFNAADDVFMRVKNG